MCTHGKNEYETCEICDIVYGGLSPLRKSYTNIPVETEAQAQGRKLLQQYVHDRMRMQGFVSGYFDQITQLLTNGYEISVDKRVNGATGNVSITFVMARSPISDLCEGKA